MANSILVIEDDALMRPSLAINLEQAGYWKSRAVSTENVARPFGLAKPLARIKTIFAALVASAAARWRQIWVPALLALGVVLLVPAAPHWTGWVQALAAYELPTEDMARKWLTNLLFDPVTTSNSLLSGAVQAWLKPAGQMDVLVTLAIIVLAIASVAGLAQLLGDEHAKCANSSPQLSDGKDCGSRSGCE